MKTRLLVILVVTLTCLAVMVACNAAPSSSPSAMLAAPLDGTNPPHAVDIDGKTIPESGVTQPDKPIILAKDSHDPKWGEHKAEAAFDHTKHHDLTHTLDGKTATACVECHHTEQPSAPTNQPYLKRFERKVMLTAEQLESSKEPVKSCRNCHWQEATAASAEFPPKSVKYPRETGKPPSGKLTNDNAYHTNCLGCHDVAMKREPKLKAPQACGDCHVKK
jgi:cytochrome c553